MRGTIGLTIIACGVLGVAAAGESVRADGLPRRAAPLPPAEPAPIYAAWPAAFNWSGLYVGAFVGGAHGVWTNDFYRNNNHGHAELGADGFTGGGWLGYNVQINLNVVLGVEADLGNSNARQSNNIFDNDTSLSEYGVYGSVRGRLGLAFDRLLLFGTVGFAYADITNDIQKGRNAGEQIVSEDKTHTGYVVGGGVEYAFTQNWIGRAEYLYNNYGTTTLFNRDGNRAEFQNELHVVRAGLSYRF